MPPRNQNSQATTAAIIICAAILVGSWVVKASLDNTTAELAQIRGSLAETKSALEKVAQARPAPAPPAAPVRRGPDPNRRYTVNTAGAPAKGPASAKVKIVEFSDFQ